MSFRRVAGWRGKPTENNDPPAPRPCFTACQPSFVHLRFVVQIKAPTHTSLASGWPSCPRERLTAPKPCLHCRLVDDSGMTVRPNRISLDNDSLGGRARHEHADMGGSEATSRESAPVYLVPGTPTGWCPSAVR